MAFKILDWSLSCTDPDLVCFWFSSSWLWPLILPSGSGQCSQSCLPPSRLARFHKILPAKADWILDVQYTCHLQQMNHIGSIKGDVNDNWNLACHSETTPTKAIRSSNIPTKASNPCNQKFQLSKAVKHKTLMRTGFCFTTGCLRPQWLQYSLKQKAEFVWHFNQIVAIWFC